MKIPFSFASRCLAWLGFGVCTLGAVPNSVSSPIVVTPEYVNRQAEAMRTNHPALHASTARVRSAESGMEAVRTWEDPMIKLGYMAAETEMRAAEGDLIYGFDQKLPLFGKPRLAREAAAADVAIERAGSNVQFQTLRRDLAQTLFRTAMAQERLQIAEEDLRWVVAMEEVLSESYKAGAAAQTQVLRLQAERARVANQVATAEKGLQQEWSALNRFLGQDLEKAWPRLVLPEVADGVDYTEALATFALRYEPRLAAMKRQVDQAEAMAAVARRQRLPDISVGVEARNYTGNGDLRQVMMTVGVSVPLFNGGKYGKDYRREKERRNAVEWDTRDYEWALREEIHHLTLALNNARREALLYRDEIIPRTEKALASVREAWSANRGMLLEVLDARRMLVEARLMHAKAVAEQWQMLSDLVLCCGLGDLEALQMLKKPGFLSPVPPPQPQP
jgi:cobalt-zinc-cadmium efflux system outer membrane protein